jgi:hypothetical protein
MKNLSLLAIGVVSVLLIACSKDVSASADSLEKSGTDQITTQAARKVGTPGIVNFFEKDMLRVLYELRDNPKYTTYTYVRDMNGHMHFLCNSIGFGIPYATQFSNPQKSVKENGVLEHPVYLSMPQAEPNALFSPSSADGTWVLCLNPNENKIAPVYEENRITASPFKLGDDGPIKDKPVASEQH